MRRYDATNGTFEHVPVHAMPDAILVNAAPVLSSMTNASRNVSGLVDGGDAQKLWIGFNVEDAGTDVKLASKEMSDGYAKKAHGAIRRGGAAHGAKGNGNKHGGSVYDTTAWAPQYTGLALPSLVLK